MPLRPSGAKTRALSASACAASGRPEAARAAATAAGAQRTPENVAKPRPEPRMRPGGAGTAPARQVPA